MSNEMSQEQRDSCNNDDISLRPVNSSWREPPTVAPDTDDLPPSGMEMSTSAGETPFSVFSRRQKLLVVILCSFAGVFSPISSVIYAPALPQVAEDFEESTQNINLTITVYLILQGLAPTIWGSLSDHLGRRLIFLVTLSIYIGACIGLALTPTSDFWLLMLLRCIQSAGGSSVIAIGAGCVSDIATREERAGYLGIFSAGTMIGPTIGPVLGGVLAQAFDWRAIFWFLVISGGICWSLILLLLPETLRSKVGNGSIPGSPIETPLVRLMAQRRNNSSKRDIDLSSRTPPKKLDLLLPLKLLVNPSVAAMLLCTSFFYATYYCVVTMFSTLLRENYGYSEIIIGVCYLANGIGAVTSTLLTGRIMDRDYTRAKLRLENKIGFVKTDLETLPMEKIRMKWMPVYVGLYLASVIGFGWSMQAQANIAVPVVMNVFIGYGGTAIVSITSTMLVDLYPEMGASVTASFNLVRCLIAAGAVALINPLNTAIGTGWAFVVASAICAASLPAMVFVPWNSSRMRARRSSPARAY